MEPCRKKARVARPATWNAVTTFANASAVPRAAAGRSSFPRLRCQRLRLRLRGRCEARPRGPRKAWPCGLARRKPRLAHVVPGPAALAILDEAQRLAELLPPATELTVQRLIIGQAILAILGTGRVALGGCRSPGRPSRRARRPASRRSTTQTNRFLPASRRSTTRTNRFLPPRPWRASRPFCARHRLRITAGKRGERRSYAAAAAEAHRRLLRPTAGRPRRPRPQLPPRNSRRRRRCCCSQSPGGKRGRPQRGEFAGVESVAEEAARHAILCRLPHERRRRECKQARSLTWLSRWQ